MSKLKFFILITCVGLGASFFTRSAAAQAEPISHAVLPGDSWLALALRYNTSIEALQDANPHPNRFREPVIGRTIAIPAPILPESTGQLITDDRSIFQLSADSGLTAWQLTLLNDMLHPAGIQPERAIFVPSPDIVREYPAGFTGFELSHIPAKTGEGMGFRGKATSTLIGGSSAIGTENGNLHVASATQNGLGLLATGAFFWEGAPHLDIVTTLRSEKAACRGSTEPDCEHVYLWSQPIQFGQKQWTFNNITLTGAAAQIDSDSIAAERARLFELWEQQSTDYLPTGVFEEPVSGYLYYSSFYGARRSYNGGPYSSYHEGLDFAAYRGTNVYASADGTVALAETLYVRGGAVIIDHGLGVYTGVYHMDSVEVTVGSAVKKGDLLGTVGSTGLSTGPHLHWDLLVNGIWVDPFEWRASNLDCWLSEAVGRPCEGISTDN
ncbi:MAG: peptidoglycan DD-metalloendopeptidase family protein [Anaerolineae bacterium]